MKTILAALFYLLAVSRQNQEPETEQIADNLALSGTSYMITIPVLQPFEPFHYFRITTAHPIAQD